MILIGCASPHGGIQDSDNKFCKLMYTRCISSSIKDTE
jgi:hypothetical protein